MLFEINLSKSSNWNIQLHKTPPNIITIAIAKNVTEIKSIIDARIYDTSSNHRRPKINEIALLQNANGFYAAIKILSIKDDTRGDENDEVTFEYLIQTNGSPVFST